jgi:hypothetical protein
MHILAFLGSKTKLSGFIFLSRNPIINIAKESQKSLIYEDDMVEDGFILITRHLTAWEWHVARLG